MLKKNIFMVFALLLTPIASEAVTMPRFLEKLPSYDIRFTVAKELPVSTFKLTERALRILPEYFIHAPAITKEKVRRREFSATIELIHKDDKRYCDAKTNMCWPKHIELNSGYIIITSWEHTIAYYRDASDLETFLWNETLDVVVPDSL